ncbi:hypothetical protein J3E68DRAFT_445878 [Trichoderma sp. SZMC 28012]
MASDSLEPPLGLMGMPAEILLEICANLCSHCSDIPINLKKDLLSLSMTSKHLRAIALPVLHHDARPRRLRSFLRTITEQPDLAAQVRRFGNIDRDIGQEYVPGNYGGCSNKLMKEMMDDMISSHYRLLGTTLAKLTNAKRLSINLPFYNGFKLKDSFKVSISVSMESVTRLSLKPWFKFDLGQMGDLLAMMPRLERLKVKGCTIVGRELPLANLRSLTLDYSDLGPWGMCRIVFSCPRLEHLDLGFTKRMEDSPTWPVEFERGKLSWSLVQRMLQSQRQTLKHLRLEFGRKSHSIRRVEQKEYFGSFCEFDGLESLWVLKDSFGSKDNDGRFPTFPESVQHLVSMLPESLTCISFSGFHKEWNGVQVMAQAIQEGYFPRLKRVMVEKFHIFHDSEKAELGYYQELFTALGVCFEVLDDEEMETKWKQHITAVYPWKF